MSYLSLPRIHFMGRSGCTPPTTNNNNYNRILDPENVAFFPPYDPPNMTDEQFREFMRTLALKNFSPFPLPPAEVLNGNWNYYGDNAYYFQNAAIYAIEATGTNESNLAQRITTATADGLIGTPVQILGNEQGDVDMPTMMIDCDPTSNFTTQLFSGKFTFGSPGCSCTALSSADTPIPRAYSRWLDLSRNLAAAPDARFGAVWMQPIPTPLLTFDTSAGNSPVLYLLQQMAGAGAGIVIRIVNYFFERKYTDPQLAALYAQGNYAMNESAGILLGTIGVWNPGEPSTYAPGRCLLPNPTPMSYQVPGQTQPSPYTLAPAAAVVDTTRDVVTIDLAMAFPEVWPPDSPPVDPPVPPPNPWDFTKIDLGTATLQVQNQDGSVTSIGTFAYDTMTYLYTAGVVEVPYSAGLESAILNGNLQVSCSTASVNPVLIEKINVADTDEHCVYITEGETAQIQVRLNVRGVPSTEPVQVALDQYRIIETDANTVDPAKGIPLKWCYQVPESNKTTPYLSVSPNPLSISGDGLVTLNITALTPGLGFIRFLAGPASDNPVPVITPGMGQWMGQMTWVFFVAVRVLPSDADLASVPDSQLTWDFIYSNVLQYYYRLYPAMDKYLKLNDPSIVASANGKMIIKARTSKDVWHSSLYMPHTREMSDGKRTVLQRWCDLPPGN